MAGLVVVGTVSLLIGVVVGVVAAVLSPPLRTTRKTMRPTPITTMGSPIWATRMSRRRRTARRRSASIRAMRRDIVPRPLAFFCDIGPRGYRGHLPAVRSWQPMPDRPWVFRTYSGHSSAEASNALYRTNLAKGQTGLSVAFDLPTQTGYDPDHELARGEVGKVGVPIAHRGDMERLFDGIPLEQMNTSMTINATAV